MKRKVMNNAEDEKNNSHFAGDFKCISIIRLGKKSVELLNNTLLIDLDKAIKDAPIGNQGNTLMSGELPSEETSDHSSENHPFQESEALQEEKKITITIRDTKITYNDRVYSSVEECDLENKIKAENKNGIYHVQLVDDYAEAHVYREVLAILRELNKTAGIEISFD